MKRRPPLRLAEILATTAAPLRPFTRAEVLAATAAGTRGGIVADDFTANIARTLRANLHRFDALARSPGGGAPR